MHFQQTITKAHSPVILYHQGRNQTPETIFSIPEPFRSRTETRTENCQSLLKLLLDLYSESSIWVRNGYEIVK